MTGCLCEDSVQGDNETGNLKLNEIQTVRKDLKLIEMENNKSDGMPIRQDSELPEATEKWGWKYHHIGIPTDKVMPNERYLPHLKFFVSGFDTSPFGIEWMRFDKDCPISDLIKSVPHIAFEVDDIDKEFAMHNFDILSEPRVYL